MPGGARIALFAMRAIEGTALLKTGIVSRPAFAEGRSYHYRLFAASHSRTHRNGRDICANRACSATFVLQRCGLSRRREKDGKTAALKYRRCATQASRGSHGQRIPDRGVFHHHKPTVNSQNELTVATSFVSPCKLTVGLLQEKGSR